MQRAPWITLLAVTVSCAHTNTVLVDPSSTLAPVCPNGVRVYTSADKVPSKYKEVALLNSTSDGTWSGPNQMITSQRKTAAKLGANAIILSSMTAPNTIQKVLPALLPDPARWFWKTPDRKGKSVAIYISDDSAKVKEFCHQDSIRAQSKSVVSDSTINPDH